VRVASAELAARVLASAKGASAEVWGKLVQEHGKKKARPGPPPPLELAGDLGIVGPPGDARSKNPRVPEPVREAAFKLKNIGDVFDEVVKDDDQYYVVRLSGKTDARSRSYHDAERSIRVAVVQARIRERESSLEKELRQKFKVSIDDAAIKALAVPSKSPAKAAP
jgi:hypothetical protein